MIGSINPLNSKKSLKKSKNKFVSM